MKVGDLVKVIHDLPEYRDVAVPKKAADLTKCKNTTKDKTGNKCPTSTDTGWYIKLKKGGSNYGTIYVWYCYKHWKRFFHS